MMPPGRDLRQAGDGGHLADQRQQAVVPPGRVVVGERRPGGPRPRNPARTARRLRPRRPDGLAGAGHGDHDRAARGLQGADDLGGRAAEGEAGDRRAGRPAAPRPCRRNHHHPSSRPPVGPAVRQGAQVPAQRLGVRARRAGDEDVHAEGLRGRGPHGRDLGGHRLGGLVPGGQEAQRPGAGGGDDQARGSRGRPAMGATTIGRRSRSANPGRAIRRPAAGARVIAGRVSCVIGHEPTGRGLPGEPGSRTGMMGDTTVGKGPLSLQHRVPK